MSPLPNFDIDQVIAHQDEIMAYSRKCIARERWIRIRKALKWIIPLVILAILALLSLINASVFTGPT